MMPNPVAQIEVRPILVPALGRDVEIHVSPQYLFMASPITGIGVEDLTLLVLVEDA